MKFLMVLYTCLHWMLFSWYAMKCEWLMSPGCKDWLTVPDYQNTYQVLSTDLSINQPVVSRQKCWHREMWCQYSATDMVMITNSPCLWLLYTKVKKEGLWLFFILLHWHIIYCINWKFWWAYILNVPYLISTQTANLQDIK